MSSFYDSGIATSEVALWINQKYPNTNNENFLTILFSDPFDTKLNIYTLKKILDESIKQRRTDLLVYILNTILPRANTPETSIDKSEIRDVMLGITLYLSEIITSGERQNEANDLYSALKNAVNSMADRNELISELFGKLTGDLRVSEKTRYKHVHFKLLFDIAKDCGQKIELAPDTVAELLSLYWPSDSERNSDPNKKSVAEFCLKESGIVIEHDGAEIINSNSSVFLENILYESNHYTSNIKVAEKIFESGRILDHPVTLCDFSHFCCYGEAFCGNEYKKICLRCFGNEMVFYSLIPIC